VREMAKLTMVQAINSALMEEMETDDRVVVLGEDVGINGGVFRVTDGLYDKFGTNRVIDTPLAEAGIVGTAVGMAVYGLRPVAEIQFMGFLPPSLEQIFCHVSRIRNRSRGRFHLPMVIRFPFGGGIHAPEHHSESLETILVHTPGLKVVVPSGPFDAKGLMKSALRDPDPVIFMEPKKIYRAFKEEIPEEDYTVPLGKAKVLREGKDLTILSWGAMVRVAIETADKAAESGWDCKVVDLRTLSPLDKETIANSVQETGRAIILHEAPRTCGVGAEVATIIMEKVFYHLEAPIERVTGFDVPMPLLKMENDYMPDTGRVMVAIEKIMTS
jgi:pyruvate dehydrogenase E1 component beta subunit